MKPLIAVVRMSSIGDIIMTSQAIMRLIQNDTEPVLICDQRFADATLCLPFLKFMITWDKQKGFDYLEKNDRGDWILSTYLEQNKAHFLGTVDLQCTARSRRIRLALKLKNNTNVNVQKKTLFRLWLVTKAFWISMIPFILGKTRLPKVKQDVYLNRNNSLVTQHQVQAVDKLLALIERQVTFGRQHQIPAGPDVNSPPTQFLQSQFLQSHDPKVTPYICLFPGASAPTKQWPKESFRELIQMILSNTSWQIRICGGLPEQPLGKFFAFLDPVRVLDQTGHLSLKETLRVLDSAGAFVSNDSFPGHAAQQFEIPGLVLFGSTTPKFGFQPQSDKILSLWANLSCSPCSRHGSQNCRFKDLACLQEISADFVYNKLIQLVKPNNSESERPNLK